MKKDVIVKKKSVNRRKREKASNADPKEKD